MWLLTSAWNIYSLTFFFFKVKYSSTKKLEIKHLFKTPFFKQSKKNLKKSFRNILNIFFSFYFTFFFLLRKLFPYVSLMGKLQLWRKLYVLTVHYYFRFMHFSDIRNGITMHKLLFTLTRFFPISFTECSFADVAKNIWNHVWQYVSFYYFELPNNTEICQILKRISSIRVKSERKAVIFDLVTLFWL